MNCREYKKIKTNNREIKKWYQKGTLLWSTSALIPIDKFYSLNLQKKYFACLIYMFQYFRALRKYLERPD